MTVEPDAGKLFGCPAEVDLLVEELGHGLVVEGDTGPSDFLFDRDELLDQERLALGRDAEAADLSPAAIAEVEQFRPGGWGEA